MTLLGVIKFYFIFVIASAVFVFSQIYSYSKSALTGIKTKLGIETSETKPEPVLFKPVLLTDGEFENDLANLPPQNRFIINSDSEEENEEEEEELYSKRVHLV